MTARFLDVSGLQSSKSDWETVLLVYYGTGRAGSVEREKSTGYCRFTPAGMPLGTRGLGDFSLEKLKGRITEWLTKGLP